LTTQRRCTFVKVHINILVYSRYVSKIKESESFVAEKDNL